MGQPLAAFERFRALRENVLDMSITEFALFIGTSRSMASAVERGVRKPGRDLSLLIEAATAPSRVKRVLTSRGTPADESAALVAEQIKLPIRPGDWS